MRLAYAHSALLTMPPGASSSAPGSAVAVALCGHVSHAGACPEAPHHIAAVRDGSQVKLRILFAVAPDRVDEIRSRIDDALAAGDWQLIDSGCARLDPADRPHARRLLKSH
jgi:hypothetical protein